MCSAKLLLAGIACACWRRAFPVEKAGAVGHVLVRLVMLVLEWPDFRSLDAFEIRCDALLVNIAFERAEIVEWFEQTGDDLASHAAPYRIQLFCNPKVKSISHILQARCSSGVR